MTEEEFKKIKLTWVNHMSMEDEHVNTYVNADYGLTVHSITPYKNGEPHGKVRTQFVLNGKPISRKKLLTMI